MTVKLQNLTIAGRVYRHIKTGGLYQIICHGLMEADNTLCVVYCSVADGLIWIRPKAEFFDGRFELVEDESVYRP